MPVSVRKSLVAAAMCALLASSGAPRALADSEPDELTRLDHLENEVMANMQAIDNVEKELGLGPYADDYAPLSEAATLKKIDLKIFGCYKLYAHPFIARPSTTERPASDAPHSPDSARRRSHSLTSFFTSLPLSLSLSASSLVRPPSQEKDGNPIFGSKNNDCPHNIADFIEAKMKYKYAHVSILNSGGGAHQDLSPLSRFR